MVKDITDEEIITCGRNIRKYGMNAQTSNMFCLPGETLEDAFKTDQSEASNFRSILENYDAIFYLEAVP